MGLTKLGEDRRGAIMVVGVFMAAVLAGALFMIIGTGDAIIYRERMQDAADATAYTAAGVHARGMNLIVLVNLVMAALLAILIALRMLIAVLGVAVAVCGAISVLSAGTLAGICAPVLASGPPLISSLEKAANSYEKFLHKALPTLSKLGRVVALTTPYVALHKSVQVSKEYAPLVTQGFAASPSMVPLLPDGKRLGLPVMEMEPDAFCKKSAELGVSHALFWAPGWLESGASKLAGAVVGSFESYFCGGGSLAVGKDIDASVKDLCDDEKDACLAGEDGAKFCTSLGDGTMDFDDKACKKDTKKTIQKGVSSGGKSPSLSLANATPKEIWDGAQHGDIWFQVWGFAFGQSAWPRHMDRGVAIASSAGMPVPDTQWGNVRIAQAELYFDAAGKWSELRPRCMWELGWRARLRRVDLETPKVGAFLPGQLIQRLKKPLGSTFEQVLKTGGPLDALFDPDVWQGASNKLTTIEQKTPTGPFPAQKAATLTWELVH